ncbi:cytochrome c biogenesis protein ResB [Geomonas sp. Red32]|uniref:cytochrome c biogenesis protein ResB n=1 Tax=Geomonas sp. Red32 TaxID=2912856 RepID=UPI00202CAFA1|nr:cytochrome c biogenesis protein ResB [Geomonas sp. Red32]MCM0080606.1 cytochrome c biogenesis protein ResB [Geomonas sp. Red32]
MNALAKKLTSRSTVIALLSLITAALLVALLVPQRGTSGGKVPGWVAALPGQLRSVVEWLGIDNVVGSSWFLVVVALFSLSLMVSTWNQLAAVRGAARRPPRADAVPDGPAVEAPLAAVAEVLEKGGYRLTASSGPVHRFVKYRLGYWGNFLLHLGLVIVVLFSLVYVVTQHRVFIRLVGGEKTAFTPETASEVLGALQFRQELPAAVTLAKLEPAFWPNDRLATLASELAFSRRPSDPPERVAVATSDKSHYGPFLVYQGTVFGRTFDLEIISPQGGLSLERLFLPYPPARNRAAYGEATLKEGLVLKAKYLADASQKSVNLADPLLTLRVYRGSDLLGETTLRRGEMGSVGPLMVRWARDAWWTDILLDGSRGLTGIFAGFAVILAGVLCAYCLVPREVLVREEGGRVVMQQVVRRFAELYRDEFDELVAALAPSLPAGEEGG